MLCIEDTTIFLRVPRNGIGTVQGDHSAPIMEEKPCITERLPLFAAIPPVILVVIFHEQWRHSIHLPHQHSGLLLEWCQTLSIQSRFFQSSSALR